MFKRVVIKLSGEALAGDKTGNCAGAYDDACIGIIATQIKKLVASGVQAALVVGGGNLWRGRQAPFGADRVTADQIGMLATVMNALYLRDTFSRMGVKSKVAAPIPIGNITEIYERDAAVCYMENKTVLINAAGLGHPLFSTDTVTALRAAELSANCVLYAKSIDGVYDMDPNKNPGARKYKRLSYKTAIAKGLEAADISALNLSNETGVPSFMFKLNEPDSLIKACSFPDTGSLRGTYIDIDIKEEFYGYAEDSVK